MEHGGGCTAGSHPTNLTFPPRTQTSCPRHEQPEGKKSKWCHSWVLLKCLCIRSTFGRSYQDGQDAMSLIFYLYPIEILDIYSCWGPTFRSRPFNVSECIRRLYAMLLLQQQKCAGFVKNFFLFNRFAVWSIMWQETVNYASQDEFLKCLVLYSVYFQSGVRTSETICI